MQKFARVRLVEADLEGVDVMATEGLFALIDAEADPPNALAWNGRRFLRIQELEEPHPTPTAGATNADAMSAGVWLYRASGNELVGGEAEFVVEMPLTVG